ncbi:MAG: ankyrin repeat domain-containing protein [Sphaerochaeta sp.]|jgi:ankyrin repeat protein|nr:ankyrin repeat domain-containing protein [Sphaerochaeta sp.]MCH3920435.1 ankyrin repeat domain-containing protein [Sphaerochaeta sp.]MCI2045930.1 ankyrin repeat domain-containing protein [Sphaerochaeta sp.]MCI2076622.1 ankyrin repeat domain-containing protein [Sphaerochaeta sp.]MCI2097387.1 ankyrin repeat domain-containing protein [Sphaerochaeta sp.]
METLDTALMDAVLDGDEELVYSLLESGVPANGRNSHGKTLLSLGLENGAPDATLKELIRHGADVNTKDEKGVTPLMIAASTPSCSPSMIRYLLRAGADPTIKNADGEDARIVAAKVGSPEVISLLCDEASCQKTNERGETLLLMAAATNQKPDSIARLIALGNPVNTASHSGTTALMIAALMNPEYRVLDVLLKAGASVNAQNGHGSTALMMAGIDPFRMEKITTLLDAGADINAQDVGGMTVLMHAVETYIKPENILLFLSRGADIHLKDKRGRTALDLAPSNEVRELLTR